MNPLRRHAWLSMVAVLALLAIVSGRSPDPPRPVVPGESIDADFSGTRQPESAGTPAGRVIPERIRWISSPVSISPDRNQSRPASRAAPARGVVPALMRGQPLADTLETLDPADELDGGTRGSVLWALDLCAQIDNPPSAALPSERFVDTSPFCRGLDTESISRWRQRLSLAPEAMWHDLGLDDILELRKQGPGEHTEEIRGLALKHLRTAGDFYSFVELGSVISAPVLEALWQTVPDHDLVLEYHLAIHAAWLKVLCRDVGGCGADGLVTLELCMSLITACRPGQEFADVVLNNLGPVTQGVFWDWVGMIEDHRNQGDRLVSYLGRQAHD